MSTFAALFATSLQLNSKLWSELTQMSLIFTFSAKLVYYRARFNVICYKNFTMQLKRAIAVPLALACLQAAQH